MEIKKIMKNIRYKWHGDLHAENLALLNTMMFMRNEALMRQNVDWDKWYLYQYAQKVHKLLPLHELHENCLKLQRVGGECDGGYIQAVPFSTIKVAYSLGIGKDVSWDKEMAELGYQIFQYDHTISKLPDKHKNFHWEKIGITGGENDRHLKRLEYLIEKNGHSKENGMILKIDIEGYEWDVFRTVDERVLTQFDQIVAELHWLFSQGEKKIILEALACLKNAGFVPIHLHPCNFAPVFYTKNLVTPDVLQVTFVNQKTFKTEKAHVGKILPIELDRRDDCRIPEIWLGDWNAVE